MATRLVRVCVRSRYVVALRHGHRVRFNDRGKALAYAKRARFIGVLEGVTFDGKAVKV